MASDDFDIDSLAAYLHLTPPQVRRLADRDRLPVRKVAGEWRFSRAEIHHWMESRMGLLDDDQLADVEDTLERLSGESTSEPQLLVADMLLPEAIAAPLKARTRGSAIISMAELAAETGLLWDFQKMAEAVRAREDMHPTAMENGVALLHPRRPMPNILAEPLLAMGRTDQGIPFGGSHGVLTDIFFLICSMEDRGHLRMLARISRLIQDESLLAGIRAASDAAAVHRMIVDREEKLLS